MPLLRVNLNFKPTQLQKMTWRSAVWLLLALLLPMPAFIAGSVNNDGLALLTATLVFAAVLRIQRLGWSWQRGLGLAALLALALASTTRLTKIPGVTIVSGSSSPSVATPSDSIMIRFESPALKPVIAS